MLLVMMHATDDAQGCKKCAGLCRIVQDVRGHVGCTGLYRRNAYLEYKLLSFIPVPQECVAVLVLWNVTIPQQLHAHVVLGVVVKDDGVAQGVCARMHRHTHPQTLYHWIVLSMSPTR